MKKFAKISALLCAVLLLGCTFLAGCTDTDESKKTYTVTAEYDAEKGSVGLSHTSAEEGTQITVTVTAKTSYAIASVTVNDDPVTLQAGKYTFGLVKDTVVKAEFTDAKPSPVPVSLSPYDAAHGTLEFSAPANGTAYAAGEKVTVTPVPAEGYEVGAVTVNDGALTPAEGVYTFDYAENSIVKASFHLKEEDLPAVSGLPMGSNSFDRRFRNTWISVDGETSLFVSKDKLALGDVGISEVTPGSSGSEQTYTFEWKGASYNISWLNWWYSEGYVIKLLNLDTEEEDYFVADPVPDVEIEEHFRGNWVEMQGDTKLKIEGNEITYNGEKALLAVDLGYHEQTNDGWCGNIQSHMYYFFTSDDAFLLGWYPETSEGGPCPTVDSRNFWADVARTYTFPEVFRGEWNGLDGTHVSIGETTFELDGEEIAVEGYNEYAFNVTIDGVEYEAKMNPSSDNVLQLVHNIYDDNGIVVRMEYRSYVKDGIPAVALDSSLYGTWRPKGEEDDLQDLHVSASGITWGTDTVTVVDTKSDAVNGFAYIVAARGNIYILSYMNLWENWEGEGDTPPEDVPEWEFSLDGNDTRTIFDKVEG